MPPAATSPLWAGRTVALVGIVLVAVNLRTAVAAISPIAEQIAVDVDLDDVGLGLIGAIPPVAFALSGLVGAALARRVGLEPLTVLCIVAIVVGQVVRGVAPSYLVLLAGSVVTFAGIGVANILLPPLVKRYFPDRVGLLTAVYVAMLAIGTAVPSALAVPIADSAGWRVSVGMWSALALVSLAPWIVVADRHRRDRRAARAAPAGGLGSEDEEAGLPQPVRMPGRIARSRTAWGIAVIFAVSSFNAYACFSWLPRLLVDTAGVGQADAGVLLALYSLVGLPSALVVPPLVARMTNAGWVVWAGAAAIVSGFLGLLLAPAAAPWLWVALAGLGPLLFPAALVLVNLRTRTEHGSIAMSAFAQGVGYTGGAAGPLLIGVLYEATDGWRVPIVVFLATAVAAIAAGFALRRRGYVEDEAAGIR